MDIPYFDPLRHLPLNPGFESRVYRDFANTDASHHPGAYQSQPKMSPHGQPRLVH